MNNRLTIIILILTAEFLPFGGQHVGQYIGAPPAHAVQFEAYAQRQLDLVSLSDIFGGLHHIRRTCAPATESTIWRNRMQNMVALEEPSNETHLKMVNAFNDGFQKAKQRFPQCTLEAQEAGKQLAIRGNRLVISLTQPLNAPSNP